MQEDLPFIYPDAFGDLDIEEKIQNILENLGVRIIKEVKLFEVMEDKEEGLEGVCFKKMDEPEPEEEEDEIEGLEDKSEGQNSGMGSGAAGTGEDGSQGTRSGRQDWF